MSAGLSRGAVVDVPAGSALWPRDRRLDDEPVRTRARRRGFVEFLLGDGQFAFVDRRGAHPVALVDEAELVTADDHSLTVIRRKLGGHPIAGWNWPIWGYDYRCGCGASLADREDHAEHLAALEGKGIS